MEIFIGQSRTFTCPSGMEVTIREQNGGDDAVISNSGYANEGTSITRFVAGIIQAVNGAQVKLTHEDVGKFKQQDVVYIILQSRINSLGSELEFQFKCSNQECKAEFHASEDLNRYLREDWGNAEGLDTYAPKGYADGDSTHFDITIDDKTTIRFDHLTPDSEKMMTRRKKSEISVNDQLLMRNPRILRGESDIPIKNFNIFPARVMSKLRSEVLKADPVFEMVSDITCPNCGTFHETPLVFIPDFFYPTQG